MTQLKETQVNTRGQAVQCQTVLLHTGSVDHTEKMPDEHTGSNKMPAVAGAGSAMLLLRL